MGWTMTILIIPLIADRVGRRWIMIGCTLTTTVCLVVLFLSRSLNLTLIMMFIAGAMTSGRVTVGFVYLNEFFTPQQQVVLGTCLLTIDTCTYISDILYFSYIGKHYLWVCGIGLITSSISSIMFLFFAPESPLWQLKTGKI